MARFAPAAETKFRCQRSEDSSGDDQPEQYESQGEWQWKEEVMELCKLVRSHSVSPIVGQMRGLEMVPGDAGGEPDMVAPKPVGDNTQHPLFKQMRYVGSP